MYVAGKVPEGVQRWAELGGAHFKGAMDPGTPPYDPDLDPVVQVWQILHLIMFVCMDSYMAFESVAPCWCLQLLSIRHVGKLISGLLICHHW
jgi:hypothetical protein